MSEEQHRREGVVRLICHWLGEREDEDAYDLADRIITLVTNMEEPT